MANETKVWLDTRFFGSVKYYRMIELWASSKAFYVFLDLLSICIRTFGLMHFNTQQWLSKTKTATGGEKIPHLPPLLERKFCYSLVYVRKERTVIFLSMGEIKAPLLLVYLLLFRCSSLMVKSAGDFSFRFFSLQFSSFLALWGNTMSLYFYFLSRPKIIAHFTSNEWWSCYNKHFLKCVF